MAPGLETAGPSIPACLSLSGSVRPVRALPAWKPAQPSSGSLRAVHRFVLNATPLACGRPVPLLVLLCITVVYFRHHDRAVVRFQLTRRRRAASWLARVKRTYLGRNLYAHHLQRYCPHEYVYFNQPTAALGNGAFIQAFFGFCMLC